MFDADTATLLQLKAFRVAERLELALLPARPPRPRSSHDATIPSGYFSGTRRNLSSNAASNSTTRKLVMPAIQQDSRSGLAISNDLELVRRALARDADAFRTIMQVNNQRLYRMARGMVRNDSEAEDIVQEAYMQAFAHLERFRGESALTTWLLRIVINEGLERLRKKRRSPEQTRTDPQSIEAQIIEFPLNPNHDDPERTMAQRQILGLVERATDNLPDNYRMVFIARVIEGLSIEETAEVLGVRPATVKTRLHRARVLVRKELDDQIGPVLLDAFPFAGRRCERLSAAVMKRLGFPY
jgi:RNA polymerase sigma-70 factor (ECF subfamily)